MGLFKKDKDKKNKKEVSGYPDNSGMPQLPELPELPKMNNNSTEKEDSRGFSLPQLPSFPNNSFGDKFSQSTIKEAVSGGKEVDSEGGVEDFGSEEIPMTQSPSEEMHKSIMTRTAPQNPPKVRAIEGSPQKVYSTQKKIEPVFIRLDKFEESLEIFEDAKDQISDIEKLLKEIKELKDKEEEELNSWENQIQNIKTQIEKVDQDIFSKI